MADTAQDTLPVTAGVTATEPSAQHAINPADLVALEFKPLDIAGIIQENTPRDAQYQALVRAQGKGAVQLPTEPYTPKAQRAIDVTTTATEAFRNTAVQTAQSMRTAQEVQNSISANIVKETLNRGDLDITVASGAQEIAERNRQVTNEVFASPDKLLAENAREMATWYKELEAQNDFNAEMYRKEGFTGFLARTFVLPVGLARADRVSTTINHRRSIQQEILADTEALAKHQISLMPTKTPEAANAELAIAASSAETAADKQKLLTLEDQQQHWAQVLEIEGRKLGVTAEEASRQASVSINKFNAQVDAIKAARSAAEMDAAIEGTKASLYGEANDAAQVERTLGLPTGLGKSYLKRLEKADPEAWAEVLKVSYGGKATDPYAFANAMDYIPPQAQTPSMRVLADKVKDNQTAFSTFLLSQPTPVDITTFKRLPKAEQDSLQAKFLTTPEGKVPSILLDSSPSAIIATQKQVAPEGVISVPAMLDKQGNVVRPATTKSLLTTGKLGEQLAVFSGTPAQSVALAEAAVLEDGRSPAEVAREFSNNYQNAMVVEAAFRGHERRKFGLDPAMELTVQVEEPNLFGGTTKKKLDLTKHAAVLAHLVRVRSAAAIKLITPTAGEAPGLLGGVR